MLFNFFVATSVSVKLVLDAGQIINQELAKIDFQIIDKRIISLQGIDLIIEIKETFFPFRYFLYFCLWFNEVTEYNLFSEIIKVIHVVVRFIRHHLN